MMEHCRKEHGWVRYRRGGHPSCVSQAQAEQQKPQPWKAVQCQRVFVQGHGSQYFEVRRPEGSRTAEEAQAMPEAGISSEALWGQFRDQVFSTWTHIENKAKSTVQEGEANEISPWLERAQWHQYSVGLERRELMSCVSEPGEDEEPVEATIWSAMDGLARFCQQSIVSRIDIFVRMKAIRPEKHQTRHQPLHSRTWARKRREITAARRSRC